MPTNKNEAQRADSVSREDYRCAATCWKKNPASGLMSASLATTHLNHQIDRVDLIFLKANDLLQNYKQNPSRIREADFTGGPEKKKMDRPLEIPGIQAINRA